MFEKKVNDLLKNPIYPKQIPMFIKYMSFIIKNISFKYMRSDLDNFHKFNINSDYPIKKVSKFL